MSTDDPTINAALLAWLNEHDYCSGDWPYEVPPSILRMADLLFGGGFKLDEEGEPIRHVRADPPTEAEAAEMTRHRASICVSACAGIPFPTLAIPAMVTALDEARDFISNEHANLTAGEYDSDDAASVAGTIEAAIRFVEATP